MMAYGRISQPELDMRQHGNIKTWKGGVGLVSGPTEPGGKLIIRNRYLNK